MLCRSTFLLQSPKDLEQKVAVSLTDGSQCDSRSVIVVPTSEALT